MLYLYCLVRFESAGGNEDDHLLSLNNQVCQQLCAERTCWYVIAI